MINVLIETHYKVAAIYVPSYLSSVWHINPKMKQEGLDQILRET
jgi:hypothetical protein